MNAANLITIDPDILGGTPVFKGTRVPAKTLFDYLADNLTPDYFLESFSSVSRELAVSVLRCSRGDIEHHASAEQGIAEEAALAKGMEKMSRKFVEKGAEVYAKA